MKLFKRKGIASSDINICMTPEQAIKNAAHVVLVIDADKVKNANEQSSKEFFN